MANTKLTPLKKITPYLRCLQITDPKTYRGPWRALFGKICALLLLVICIAALCAFNLCFIWKSTTTGWSFQAITVHLSTTQVIWLHISAIRNYQQISQTFKNLSKTIAPRKLYIFEKYTISRMLELNTSYLIGNSAFYETSEEKHSGITEFIFKASFYIIVIFFGVAAMIPLFYAFGYPEPEQWIAPFGLP